MTDLDDLIKRGRELLGTGEAFDFELADFAGNNLAVILDEIARAQIGATSEDLRVDIMHLVEERDALRAENERLWAVERAMCDLVDHCDSCYCEVGTRWECVYCVARKTLAALPGRKL